MKTAFATCHWPSCGRSAEMDLVFHGDVIPYCTRHGVESISDITSRVPFGWTAYLQKIRKEP